MEVMLPSITAHPTIAVSGVLSCNFLFFKNKAKPSWKRNPLFEVKLADNIFWDPKIIVIATMTTAKIYAFPNSSTSVKSILTTCIESRLLLFMVQHYEYWIKVCNNWFHFSLWNRSPLWKTALCAPFMLVTRATYVKGKEREGSNT